MRQIVPKEFTCILFRRNAAEDRSRSQPRLGLRVEFDLNRHGSASCEPIIRPILREMEARDGLELWCSPIKPRTNAV
jgi:hypothetical protein